MEKNFNVVETKPQTEEVASEFFDLKIITDGKPCSKPQKIKRTEEDISVSCFVMLTDSPLMYVKGGSYNLDLLGLEMFQYVVRACPSVPACIKFDEKNDNLLALIKPYLKDTEYTLVLFSDTPLVTKSNILNILDFAKTKGLNVCKLTRGYVFKTEYIKRVDEIYAPSTYYFEEEDFMMAVTYKQLYIISETLKNRIISYHMQNGVYFKSPDTTYIEANVSIGGGAVIEPFVSLIGDTDIGEDAVIGCKSVLRNAKILSGAQICGAYIDGGVVMENAKVKMGAKLFSQTAIKEGAEVYEDAILSNAIIGSHSMVGKGTIINYLNCDENVCIGDNCKIIGTKEKPVNISRGGNLEDMVTLLPGVKIKENEKVKIGETKKIKAGENL